MASLACQTVTDLIEEDPEYYETEEPAPSESKEPATAEEPSQEALPSEVPEFEALSCPATTDKILKAALAPVDEEYGDEEFEEPEILYLVTYTVFGDEISDPYFEDVSESELIGFQEDERNHQKIWDYFITLIPLEDREAVLVEYSIMTDGKENSLAAVGQTYNDPELWSLEVDIADIDDTLNLIYTLIHEYAHLLTLGPEQVPPSMAVFNNPDDDDIYYDESSACPVYFPGEGCSKANSYINAFFNDFWADIHEEWQDINLIEDSDDYYDALDDFYYNYEDSFLTDYAVTTPEEDIAEAFTFFVLSPRPNGDTIAEEKILFFYDYPELLQLRDEIINGVCSLDQ